MECSRHQLSFAMMSLENGKWRIKILGISCHFRFLRKYIMISICHIINILLFTQLGFVGLYFVLCYSLYKYDVMYDSKMPILATSPLYKL